MRNQFFLIVIIAIITTAMLTGCAQTNVPVLTQTAQELIPKNATDCENLNDSEKDLCLLDVVYSKPGSLPPSLTGQASKVSGLIANQTIPLQVLLKYIVDNSKETGFRTQLLSGTMQRNLSQADLKNIEEALTPVLIDENQNPQFTGQAAVILARNYYVKSYSSEIFSATLVTMMRTQKDDDASLQIMRALETYGYDVLSHKEVIFEILGNFSPSFAIRPMTTITATLLMSQEQDPRVTRAIETLCGEELLQTITKDTVAESRAMTCAYIDRKRQAK